MDEGEIDGPILLGMKTGETSTEHTGGPGRHRGARAGALSVRVAEEQREDTHGKRTRAGKGDTREINNKQIS